MNTHSPPRNCGGPSISQDQPGNHLSSLSRIYASIIKSKPSGLFSIILRPFPSTCGVLVLLISLYLLYHSFLKFLIDSLSSEVKYKSSAEFNRRLTACNFFSSILCFLFTFPFENYFLE